MKEAGGNWRLFCFFDPYRREIVVVESAWQKSDGGKTQQGKHIQRLKERFKEYRAGGIPLEEK